jgi:hypothetical protein
VVYAGGNQVSRSGSRIESSTVARIELEIFYLLQLDGAIASAGYRHACTMEALYRRAEESQCIGRSHEVRLSQRIASGEHAPPRIDRVLKPVWFGDGNPAGPATISFFWLGVDSLKHPSAYQKRYAGRSTESAAMLSVPAPTSPKIHLR